MTIIAGRNRAFWAFKVSGDELSGMCVYYRARIGSRLGQRIGI